MMAHYIFFLFLFISINLYPQIRIKLHNSNINQAVLYSLSGEKTSFKDSINLNEGVFNFKVQTPGFYRLLFTTNKWIDFIYDEEEVEIESDANNIPDNLIVRKSLSNQLYYEFLSLNKSYKTKSELLQLIITRYPEEDDYYRITKKELIQLQKDYLAFVNVTAQKDPGSYIARYVRTAQLPVVDVEIPWESYLQYFKIHALENVDFNDDELIYSDAFTSKSIEYLTYYRNPQLPMEMLESEFVIAIDTILGKAKINQVVYKHITEYLVDGFRKFGFDNIISYIVDNYVIKDDLCLDETLGNTIDRRIQQSKYFKPGSTVPGISLPDPDGSVIELNKINSDRILLIFYASWCPHCKTLLPQIYDVYKNQGTKHFEVLAVSIDSSKSDWLDFISSNNLNWLNASDSDGWDGQSALDYQIYATPSMFMLDKNFQLVGMPKNLDEIIQQVK